MIEEETVETDLVFNNGWPTTWRQRMPFDATRGQQLVIDPGLERLGWANTLGPNYFYRCCTDPDNGIARVQVKNFTAINSVDYKIFSVNLSNHFAAGVLNCILTNPEPRKLLHISIDDHECRYPEHLMDTFCGMEFTGQLAIEIVDNSALRYSIDRARKYRQCLPVTNPNLISIDYHYNFENGAAAFLDLKAKEPVTRFYNSIVVKQFE